nr:BON domain-containing protein [uncultured Fluviicola sp.]
MKTDSQVQKDVMEELKWQPSINSSEIGVSVKEGIVTLSGTVDQYIEKRDAEKAALRVEGVKGVAEDIEVKLSFGNKKNDADIAKAAINALHWDSMVPDNAIKVKVENGWITAEGKVDWLYQKSAVRDAISNLTGVKGVINLITINPSANPVDIKKKIVAAFDRNASIDANNIQVLNEGDRVVLKGTVRSYAERLDAQHAAWNAPGVAHVDNQLEVKIPSYSAV